MATTFTYPTTVTMTGVATTINSNVITVAASAAGSWGVAIGAVLSHANLPAGTYITGYTATTTATISANATATGSALTVTATNPSTINMDKVPAIVKTGGDIFNINGTNFVIDGHSRFDLNSANTSATAATSLGSITISATLGGTCTIDGRYVRLIPFTGGSGTIPALGSTVTQGSASGKLMCVYSSLTAAPLVNGGTMPATGWIQVKQWNGTEYSAGALTLSGVTATASGASTVGFLEIMGDEASTVNANRLGTFNILGEWYNLGITNGTANQQFQVPNHGTLRHIAGVYIEKTAGAKDYEFYPNAGTATTVGTEATRGKVCWITNTGLVRLGHNGTANMGYTPASGLGVVIPNIMLCNCTTAARNAVVIPNATIATRYDFTTTGGGVVNIDKANMEWYPSFAQAYSVQLTNTGIIDSVNISEVATPMNWSKVGVGNKPTTALVVSPLTMSLCFAGGTFTDCVWAMVSQSASGNHIASITDVAGFTFTRDTMRANTIRGNATTYSLNGTRMVNCNYIDPVIIQGAMTLTTCTNMNITNTTYCEAVSGTTVTTYAGYVWTAQTNSSNITISGLSMPVTNCQPYTALLFLTGAPNNIKMRNIGTLASPLNLGTTNGVGLIWTAAGGAAASDIKIQRVYCSNTRTGQMTGDNSSTRVLVESVFGDYADAADVSALLNFTQKGLGTTKALTAQTGVYGTHFVDYFTSTTAGRIAILMNETTSLTASQVTLENGANFTATGGLYMPTIGMKATFELPYYVLGHTGFTNTALVMAGGTATNYTYGYQIDKNDGNGWSTLASGYTATTLGTALSGITGIDASKGFKLRLIITTGTTNTTAITSVYMTTVSTVTAQGYQYPLDQINLTLTGLVSGSDVVILSAGTSNQLTEQLSNPGNTFSYLYEVPSAVDIGVFKSGYVPFYIRNYSLSTSNASLPIAQVPDRNYGG